MALTRAKCSLWVVGNGEVLNSSELWQTLLQQIYQRGALRHADDFKDIFSQWKATKEEAG